MYMVAGDEPSEGACLVFAHDRREALHVGWPVVSSWMLCDRYIDLRASRIKNHDYLFAEADQLKLSQGEAHVIDSPKACVRCDLWGTGELNGEGVCETCRELDDDELETTVAAPKDSPDATP